MSIAGIDIGPANESDPIFTIADEVFTAMIDYEPGHLTMWHEDRPTLPEAMYAWVDVGAPTPGRVMVEINRDTATQISRALLMLEDSETISDADFIDALGEIANVVGGNVKALVPEPGALTLPTVDRERPETTGTPLYDLPLRWRDQYLAITLWQLDPTP